MVLVVVARNGLLFLVGWEAMALAAFFLIATEHRNVPAQRAAWVYLVATHVGTAALIGAFALLQRADDTLDWHAGAAAGMSQARAVAVFALALLGFGLKAGLMPLHVWLPAAHASAPSHVSAVLSGVMIKMGAYGVLRTVSLLPPLPAACGAAVLALGALSALLGIAASLGQSDLKRLLAYSSIENIGIVFLGIGLGLLGRAVGSDALVVLGLGGGLLHVLNHGLFKPLLFLGAGSVLHATQARDLDALGGLWRRMPRTGTAFLLGAAAISGLPLLNGFASEFMLYLGLFHAVGAPDVGLAVSAAAAIAGLALTGGLAVVGFVRAAGAVFLGAPRTPSAAAAHESPPSMTTPLLLLAAGCVTLGLVPAACAPLLDAATAATLPGGVRAARRRRRPAADAPVGTWDCGYVGPTSPRLQYTGTSFAQPAVRALGWTVRGHTGAPAALELFPGPRAFVRRATEPLLHGVLWPLAHRCADRCARLRFLQRGKLHVYLLYILVAHVLLLAWSSS
jgi:formate hydrogenlyase subunit 3/multisubunit Na+/H+ antiporter MnhD subunit